MNREGGESNFLARSAKLCGYNMVKRNVGKGGNLSNHWVRVYAMGGLISLKKQDVPDVMR